MLVSTLEAYWAFVSMLLGGGRHRGEPLLAPGSVADMTRDHLPATQRASAPPFLEPGMGWGSCTAAAAPVSRPCRRPVPYGFGWNGGTGTAWTSDPERGLTGILLTQRAMMSPEPPQVFVDFWEAAYGALGDRGYMTEQNG